MNSPYLQNSGFSMPSMAAAGQVQLDREKAMRQQFADLQDNLTLFGKMAAGAVGGATSPGVFGAGTSSFGGAMQGLAANVNPNGKNFQQIVQMGKSADAYRAALKAATPSVNGQEPKVLGVTDDEWKTFGAEQKATQQQAHQDALATERVMQNIADMQAMAQERQAKSQAIQQTMQDNTAAGDFVRNFFQDPNPDLTTKQRFSNAAANTPGFSGRLVPQIVDHMKQWKQIMEDDSAGDFLTRLAHAPGDTFIDQLKNTSGVIPIPNSLAPSVMKTMSDWSKLTNPENTLSTEFQEVPGANAVAVTRGKSLSIVQKPGEPTSHTLQDENGNVTGTAFWNGKGWIQQPIKQPQTPKVSPIFDKTMGEINRQITSSSAKLSQSDEELGGAKMAETSRASAKRNLATAMQRGKVLVDSQFRRGAITEDERNDHYEALGITTAPATTATKGSGLIRVMSPDGKLGSIPASQLETAKARGFKPLTQ